MFIVGLTIRSMLGICIVRLLKVILVITSKLLEYIPISKDHAA